MQPKANKVVSKQNRLQYLEQMQHWCAEGRMAINDPQQNITAAYNWQQQATKYRAHFYSSFSTESITVNGDGDAVNIVANNGAKNSEVTLEKKLPFVQLTSWLKGIPAPASEPQSIKYDDCNQLQTFRQDGWLIEYQSYHATEPISLPEKMTINDGHTKVKVVIKHWQK